MPESRMTDDVVGRLRAWVAVHDDKLPPERGVRRDMLLSAADEIDRLTAALASEREARQKAEEWIKIVSDDVRKRIPEGQNKDQANSPYAAVGCMVILTGERDTLRSRVKALEEALTNLEGANERLASRRSRELYLAMIAVGAGDDLAHLDDARSAARSVLKETKDG